MAIEAALFDVLKDDAGVGTVCGDRIYPLLAPDNAVKPYIVYEVIGTEPQRITAGAGTLKRTRMHLDCYDEGASGYGDAKSLADAVRTAIDNARGTWDSGGSNETTIRRCFIDDETDGLTNPADGGDVPTFRRILSVTIWHL